MTIADADGTPIYYERHGSGPAVLLVHGSGGHHAAWWQQVVPLRERFTVVTVDLRGFGSSGSSMAEFDGQDLPGDILAVLDQEDVLGAARPVQRGGGPGAGGGRVTAGPGEEVMVVRSMETLAGGPWTGAGTGVDVFGR
jgi:alpha-beta hydrolase superfamily lysophospholipase